MQKIESETVLSILKSRQKKQKKNFQKNARDLPIISILLQSLYSYKSIEDPHDFF